MMGVFVPFDEERHRILTGWVLQENGCWEWIGRSITNGYGQVKMNGCTRRAHRIVYERVKGPIPQGLTLDHLCRNRRCVNPDHLEPVTNRENLRRGMGLPARNARKTHCVRGHEFTPENTWYYGVWRVCRTCKRAEHRASRRRRREPPR